MAAKWPSTVNRRLAPNLNPPAAAAHFGRPRNAAHLPTKRRTELVAASMRPGARGTGSPVARWLRIGDAGIAASRAGERLLGSAIGLVDKAALWARVARINGDCGKASGLCRVGRELAKLTKRKMRCLRKGTRLFSGSLVFCAVEASCDLGAWRLGPSGRRPCGCRRTGACADPIGAKWRFATCFMPPMFNPKQRGRRLVPAVNGGVSGADKSP